VDETDPGSWAIMGFDINGVECFGSVITELLYLIKHT
jgi:hypothetical protein